MDVFDSPLNLAHQQGRKADVLVDSAKFDEAIGCHRKAAQLLSEALDATPTTQAKESLLLQQRQHQLQISVIQSKQHQHQLKLKADKAAALKLNSPSDEVVPNGDNLSAAGCDQMDASFDVCTRVHRTMQECDSLLQFLNDRSGMSVGARYKPPTGKAPKNNYRTMIESASKTPKDDKQIIEELEGQNEYLRKHIENLLDENQLQKSEIERLRSEREILKARNHDLVNQLPPQELSESTEDYGPIPKGMTLDDLPSMELPPLEMPNFDFQDPFRIRNDHI